MEKTGGRGGRDVLWDVIYDRIIIIRKCIYEKNDAKLL